MMWHTCPSCYEVTKDHAEACPNCGDGLQAWETCLSQS